MSNELGFRRLPIRLYDFEDGLTVVATTHEWRNLLGSRIQAIGGDRGVAQRLFALGLLPGTALKVVRLAPLGDPITVQAGAARARAGRAIVRAARAHR